MSSRTPATSAQVTQVGPDVVLDTNPAARVTQLGLEVIFRVAEVPTTARSQVFGSMFATGLFGYDIVIDNAGEWVVGNANIVVDNAAEDVVDNLGDIVEDGGDVVITNTYWH